MSFGTHHRATGWLWKVPLIATAYFASSVIAGASLAALGLQIPEAPGQVYDPLHSLAAALVLAAAIALLARGLRGSTTTFRWLAMFAFIYVAFCINNQIEGAIFTTAGGQGTKLLFFIFPSIVLAGTAVGLFAPPDEAEALTSVFSDRGPGSWWWRAVLAWLSFPVIYYLFGAVIYPFVGEFYESGQVGLTVPSQGVIIGAVTIRSLLFLLVIIPILGNWSGSRRSLVLALGVALAAMVGVVGMIEATSLPTRMRIVHGLEITADSLVHALVLVTLLVSKNPRSEEGLSPAAAR
jgi:hypothetical protein